MTPGPRAGAGPGVSERLRPPVHPQTRGPAAFCRRRSRPPPERGTRAGRPRGRAGRGGAGPGGRRGAGRGRAGRGGAGPRRACSPRRVSLAAAAVTAAAAPGAGANPAPAVGPGWVSGPRRGPRGGVEGPRGGRSGRPGRVGPLQPRGPGGAGVWPPRGEVRGPSGAQAPGVRRAASRGAPLRQWGRPGPRGGLIPGRSVPPVRSLDRSTCGLCLAGWSEHASEKLWGAAVRRRGPPKRAARPAARALGVPG